VTLLALKDRILDERGRDGFYAGEVGNLIVAEMEQGGEGAALGY
jgi:gamma-glutamyltranspeptidase